jgi:Cu(I)/Ag(I) efflux system membrane fusion protein
MTRPPTNRSAGWASWLGVAVALVAALSLLWQPLAAWFCVSTECRRAASAADAPVSDGSGGEMPEAMAGATSNDEVHHYTCSMHPSVKQPGPGKCPICGMDLIPVSKTQQEQGVVIIDELRRQLIGVRTAPVSLGPMRRTFRAVGRVTYDESTLSDVNLKVGGWITNLLVSETGQRVRAGQPLFLLYSPELYNAQQDFLLANRSGGGSAAPTATGAARHGLLGAPTRQRLHLLGLSDAQIDALAKRGQPSESIAIQAPSSGFVIEKNVVEGASVEAGTRLYRIAGLNSVWIEADVYEPDLPLLRAGQGATVSLDYLPGRLFETKVDYVYPYLDPATRTGKVRLKLDNPKLDLRPGMYARVDFQADAEPRVQVPASAVVYTGPRRLVFLDLGEGRFRPQEVSVGNLANDMYEVLAGLVPGDRVATSGLFLIAAEARISTAAKYWEKPAIEQATPGASPAGARTLAPDSPPAPSGSEVQKTKQQTAPSVPAETMYSCPMHPEVRSSSPGKCPKCGMQLQALPHGAAP